MSIPWLILILLGGIAAGAGTVVLAARRWRHEAFEDGAREREPEFAALREQRDALERRTAEVAEQVTRLERDRALGEQRLQAMAANGATFRAKAEELARQLDALQLDHASSTRQLQALSSEHSALKASAHEQALAAAEKLALLDQAELRLRESFQNLANQILETKAERFREQSSVELGGLLDPLKLQLKEFRESITQTHANEQRERGMLAQEIRSLRDLNQQISQDAINLTRALRGDSRAQGAWGEMVLERVLEASGLQAGREYLTQASFRDDDGRQQRPDVIVRLPGDKDIVIDAKVSLVAYERLTGAEDDAERAVALNDHLTSLRRHIDGLSGKNYSDIEDLRTLDFVLLFVPVEAAFIEAVRADGGLYAYALGKNISLVSPSTLLATLRTVAHLWRIERRNVNAIEIARRAANLHDNFALLVAELTQLGTQLDRAQGAHASALRRLTEGGKGSVLLQVQSLADMGAPARKQLPAHLLERAGAVADDALAELEDDPA